MGGFSIWHWFVVLVYLVIIVWPVSRIISRAGYSPWLSLVAVVPLLNLISLWIFAYVRWPALGNAAPPSPPPGASAP